MCGKDLQGVLFWLSADIFCKNLNRMKGKKEKVHREAVKELEQSINLVKAPSVLQQEPSLTLPKTKVKVSQQQAEENHLMEE